MPNPFFDAPILNSPYEYPDRHWELDSTGQPTQQTVEQRRRADFITPIPRGRRQRAPQAGLDLQQDHGLDTPHQNYDITSVINEVRGAVDAWRRLPNARDWKVTPETARLLEHWRHFAFSNQRPFFCQVEAAETAIWLTEVAPHVKSGERVLAHLTSVGDTIHPGLTRIALKLATGAGKTTVMAMLMAWQTINAVRRPSSAQFSRGFLIVTPGITIRDRLRVLQPNDPDNYYQTRELVPTDMLSDMQRAKVVITNYHAFLRRERVELSKGGRQLLQGRTGDAPVTVETEGQMLQRVLPDLMGLKQITVINDEAHHCYREKPADDEDYTDGNGNPLTGEDLKEAKERAKTSNASARVWMAGIEAVNRTLGVRRVLDLSATPFFLAGSGYAEGTLFPWTVSDFSLMDAIECGIVKLPRVPVAQNLPGAKDDDLPVFRELWKHIRTKMPKKRRGAEGVLDPLKIPTLLQTALDALYGHYQQTFDQWQARGIGVPPCFIIVCNNTATSKLIYDYVSGFIDTDGQLNHGRLPLFQNFDRETGNPLPRPNTLLIDSEQLESGEALDDQFRDLAAPEIERFRRELTERRGTHVTADSLTDQDLLREVMNTVGKRGALGGDIRCVVSVSMLTEGWDTNTVTHVLGIRAFGTQLLCEQVIGRALRRQSYDLNDDGRFNVEYADVLGIPFNFTAKPVVAPPQAPRETVLVKAMRPERDALEIRFPRVEGYRVEPLEERLAATFDRDSVLVLTPELTGPTENRMEGIIGQGVDLTVRHLKDVRHSEIIYRLTMRLIMDFFRDPGEAPRLHLFGQMKRIVKQWLEGSLECKGGTYPAQLLYLELADMACQRIKDAITRTYEGQQPVKALLDPFNPTGSSAHVRFTTSKPLRWQTRPDKCHVNLVVLDSNWETEFCRVAESHPRVFAYVKNQTLGFEVPYRNGSEARRYQPDFIVLVDDGHGRDNPLHLVVEIKGYRGEDAQEKSSTMRTYWVPGVNNLGTHGRWAFAEFGDVFTIQDEFAAQVARLFDDMIEHAHAE